MGYDIDDTDDVLDSRGDTEPWCDENYEDPRWEPASSPWDTAVPDPDTLPLFPEPTEEHPHGST